MFTATGVGVRKNADNTVTVKVQVTDDRDGKAMWTREYTAKTVVEAQQHIQQDLKALMANETDATLNAAVVGQVLGTI